MLVHIVVTAFCNAIAHVFKMRSQEQMIGIHAVSHVAFVANAETFRNWPVSDHPDESMRIHLLPTIEENPISIAIQTFLKKPTRISLLNFLPKALDRVRAYIFFPKLLHELELLQ